jgi:hypothetical protein
MCGHPGHTYSERLVFFGKPGVTEWYQSNVDCRTYAKVALVDFLNLFCYKTIFPSLDPLILPIASSLPCCIPSMIASFELLIVLSPWALFCDFTKEFLILLIQNLRWPFIINLSLGWPLIVWRSTCSVDGWCKCACGCLLWNGLLCCPLYSNVFWRRPGRLRSWGSSKILVKLG